MMDDLKTEIRRVIRRYFESGQADKLNTDGKAEIAKLVKKYGVTESVKSEIYALKKEVEAQMFGEFAQTRVGGSPEMQRSGKMIDRVMTEQSGSFKRLDRSILRGVMEGVSKAVKGDMNWADTARAALRKLGMKEHHIETEITTTKTALDNVARVHDFELAGVTHLRYLGPSGTVRPFCAAHVDKTFPIEEVMKMVNGFNQPAYAYCGGYNCRHRWAPVEKGSE